MTKLALCGAAVGPIFSVSGAVVARAVGVGVGVGEDAGLAGKLPAIFAVTVARGLLVGDLGALVLRSLHFEFLRRSL